jgi:hypothetical protein
MSYSQSAPLVSRFWAFGWRAAVRSDREKSGEVVKMTTRTGADGDVVKFTTRTGAQGRQDRRV